MKAKTTDQTIPLRDRCLSHFATLRIPVEATALDELLTQAEKEGYSHLSFLDRLLGAEAGARRERAVARRIREASLPKAKRWKASTGTSIPKPLTECRWKNWLPATLSAVGRIW
jgi:DNA replication protein DnaC